MKEVRHFYYLCAISLLGLILMLGSASEARAQGSNNSNGIPHKGSSCPNEGWKRGDGRQFPHSDRCYPTSSNSPKIYRVGHDNEKCSQGYGRQWGFCIEGYDPNWMANQKGNLDKANPTDRCPAGWVTAPPLSNGKTRCRPDVSNPSTARAKGAGACNANEIAEWGIWCTSKYEHLTAKRVKQSAAADWNDIYTATRGKEPRQSPDDNGSEVYRALLAKEGGNEEAPPKSINERHGVSMEIPAAYRAPAETEPQVTSTSDCGAAALGGALGQAVGGETAEVLGKMLGGLTGKSSRPSDC